MSASSFSGLARLKSSKGVIERHYYPIFTLCFFVLAFLVFSRHIFGGLSLIRYGDGWSQHFKALLYYSHFLKEIIRNLIYLHRLVIPEWDFCISEGSDILNALHYYVIGDPITLLSVFVPSGLMHYFYSASCVLRMYLAGIAFSLLCFGTGQKNRWGILAGALSYSFCAWSIINATSHPFFLNPLIYFPLLILGLEKILRHERPYMFIFSVTISAVSNFYFFYVIVLLTVFYVLVRLGFLFKANFRLLLSALLRIFLYSIVGTCIAGILLLPVTIMFLQDSRIAVSQPFHLLYPLNYYLELATVTITDSHPYWLFGGFSVPAVLAVFLLFIKRDRHGFLRSLFFLCLLFILLPIAGRLFNGMSYMVNRWSWVLALLVSYTLCVEWNALLSLSKNQWQLLFLLSVLLFVALLFLPSSRNTAALAAIPLFFVSLFLIRAETSTPDIFLRQLGLLSLLGASLFNLAFWLFSPNGTDFANSSLENRQIENLLNSNESAIFSSDSFSPDAYYRYSGRNLTYNIGMLKGLSDTSFCLSNCIPSVSNYRRDMYMREDLYQRYFGYDDRTSVILLSAVQYYITHAFDTRGLPYGFEYLRNFDSAETMFQSSLRALKNELGATELSEAQEIKLWSELRNVYSVYVNKNPLPLTYCYDAYLPLEVWNTLDPVQKQEVQLSAAMLPENPKNISSFSEVLPNFLVPFELNFSGEITAIGNRYVITKNDQEIKVTLSEVPGASEIYIAFEGLSFTPSCRYDLYFGNQDIDPLDVYNKVNWNLLSLSDKPEIRKEKLFWDPVQDVGLIVSTPSGLSKTLYYRPPDSLYSSGRQDFIVNLGYMEEPCTSFTVTLPLSGVYTVQDLRVYSVPTADYPQKVAKLKENCLQELCFGTNSVSGSISLDAEQILCLATPYSPGWEVYVDGEMSPALCVNERYVGVQLSAGAHEVRFVYSRPYQRAGLAVSIVGLLSLVGIIVLDKWKKRRL